MSGNRSNASDPDGPAPDGSPSTTVTGAAANSAHHNLPSRLTSFVGRKREIAEVSALAGSHRLVTLVGAPGVGKTRLSLEIARALLDSYPEGVWLVELAALADPGLVPQALATILGVREQPHRSLTETLVDVLRDQRVLALLDNCEHLVLAAATLAESLLRSCPGVHILATSREPLAIEGELTWGVPSLSVAVTDGAPRSDPGSIATVESAEATRLFVERARAAVPTFELTVQNAADIAQICARLDGIPLAIELAAARSRALSVAQIAARLDDRFRLLTNGSRTALPRQQTLRGTVDWSYELLSGAERSMLRWLAVFAGGFTLDAIEGDSFLGLDSADAKLAPSASGSTSRPATDLLTSLVDKSLVQVDESYAGGRRFRLLETIRQYGQEKLVAHGELTRVRGWHRDFYLALAEDANTHLIGPGQKEALARLEREHDNLRAALAWCLEEAGHLDPERIRNSSDLTLQRTESAVRIAGALWRFWWMYGHLAEGGRSLDRALSVPSTDNTPDGLSARATAHFGAGHMAGHLGDYRSAITHSSQALALWRKVGNDSGTTRALHRLGNFLVHVGETERGIALCNEAVELARRVGHAFDLSMSLHTLSVARWILGHLELSAALCEEGLALCRTVGYAAGVSFELRLLSRSVGNLGDPERATRLVEEALAISEDLGDKGGIAEAYKDLAHIARVAGDPERGLAMLRVSLPLHRALGERWLIALSLHDLAGVMTLRGVRSPAMPTANRTARASARECLVAAARLFAAAEALRNTCGVVLPVPIQRAHERDIAVLRDQLGSDGLSIASAEGQAMSYHDAIEYALKIAAPAEPEPGTNEPASARQTAVEARSVLTNRERAVARLLARGHTNRRIAEELILSERTVDTHVHNILGKLELTSRAQVAVWAVENGLTGDR
ncbi:MAG: LuxR C-terminal-related transcriptional regulator [Chloroflexota bacterium]